MGITFLTGWKQIATHLDRGVRTVQRWERMGLPVRRPLSTRRGRALAVAEEVDAWVASTLQHRGNELTDPRKRVHELKAEIVDLRPEPEQRQMRTATRKRA